MHNYIYILLVYILHSAQAASKTEGTQLQLLGTDRVLLPQQGRLSADADPADHLRMLSGLLPAADACQRDRRRRVVRESARVRLSAGVDVGRHQPVHLCHRKPELQARIHQTPLRTLLLEDERRTAIVR